MQLLIILQMIISSAPRDQLLFCQPAYTPKSPVNRCRYKNLRFSLCIDIYRQRILLYDNYQKTNPDIKCLSMGMTNDLPEAIMCGSTMVRIGTAIFGAREYHK